MSDLYKESLIEAQKLLETAKEAAEKTVVEKMAPQIKEIISEQISSNFFIEEDGDTVGLGLGQSALGDTMGAAPIATPGADSFGATQVPGDDGLVTFTLDSLLGDQGPADVGAAPMGTTPPISTPDQVGPEMPVEPTDAISAEPPMDGDLPLPEDEPLGMTYPESVTLDSYKSKLHEASEKIDLAFHKGELPLIVKESLKNRLFGLLKQLDLLKKQGKISVSEAKLNENKLEFLFVKLKDANLTNSYIEKHHKDTDMTSLKEFAAKLWEESTYADEAKADGTEQETTASAKHAADQSGISPELGQSGPEDVKAKEEDGNPGGINEEMLPGSAGSVDEEPLPGTDPEPGEEKQWAKGEASLDEKDQDKVIEEALASLSEENTADAETEANDDVAEGAAGFGDTHEDPAVEPFDGGKSSTKNESVEFEVDEAELKEALDSIRKEGIQGKLAALAEASDGKDVESWEDGEPEGGDDPSHKNLKEMSMPMEMEMDDDLGGEMDMELEGEPTDADLVLHIELPDAVEDALASVDVSAMDDVDVELADVNLGAEAGPVGDEVVPPVVDDVVETEPPMQDEEYMHEMKKIKEAYAALEKKAALSEARLKKAKGMIAEHKEARTHLEAELKEANLFMAKNICLTKFMQRGDLNKNSLAKIVDYLDRAKTVNEAHEIYKKIKIKLQENASKKLAGSSSQVTSPGSATGALNESAQHHNSGDAIDVARWQKLAGMKVKK